MRRNINLLQYYSPEDIAVRSGGGYLTYRAWGNLIINLKADMERKGIRPGDRVAVLSRQNIITPAIILAVIASGGIAAPLSTRLPRAALLQICKQINACFLISDQAVDPDHGGWNGKFIRSQDLVWNYSGDNHPQLELPMDMPATIVMTSGTGGKPKGVVHSLSAHYHSAIGSAKNIPFRAGDSWLLTLPLFHAGGLAILFRCMFAGATLDIGDPDEDLLFQMARSRPTHISLVSTQLYRLLHMENKTVDFSSLKAVLLGGGPVPFKLIRKGVRRSLPLFRTYGSTEMASQVTTTTAEADLEELKTAGYPLPHRLLNLSGDGEILVGGETACRSIISADGTEVPKGRNRWIASGDLGYTDESGRLIVLGRKDNMFISGGENIQPEEIEGVLEELESIRQAVVVPVDDPEFGQRPFAFVDSALKPAEIDFIAVLKEHLPRFKWPVHFAGMPQTGSVIKPSRQMLKSLAAGIIKK